MVISTVGKQVQVHDLLCDMSITWNVYTCTCIIFQLCNMIM